MENYSFSDPHHKLGTHFHKTTKREQTTQTHGTSDIHCFENLQFCESNIDKYNRFP